MNKKAQFYIFTAIVLSAILVTMTTTHKQQSPETNTIDLYDNFIDELPYVVNSKIFNSKDPVSNIDLYLRDFKDFSDYHSTTFTYLYIFKNHTKMFIKNKLNNSAYITVKNFSFTLQPNENRTLTVSDAIVNTSSRETFIDFNSSIAFEFKGIFSFTTFDSIQIRELT